MSLTSNYLSAEQVDQLLRPINPRRVFQRDGMAYVEAHDGKAHLNRIFGFCRWSSEVVEQHLICEEQVQTRAGKPAWYVAYRSVVQLTICAPDGTQLAVYTEGHVGDSTHPVRGEAHGNAVTNSESYAFKRCCIPLGSQFGLSLYSKGSMEEIVKRTLVHPSHDGHLPAYTPVDHDAPDIVPEHPIAPEAPDASGVAAAPPPADPSEAPFPSDEELGAVQRAHVEALRDKVILALGNKHPKDGLAALTRCNLDASRHKLMQEMTVTPKGEPCTVAVLIDEAIKHLSREQVAP